MKGEPKTTPITYKDYDDESDDESEDSEEDLDSDNESKFSSTHAYFIVVISLLLLILFNLNNVKDELKNIFIDE